MPKHTKCFLTVKAFSKIIDLIPTTDTKETTVILRERLHLHSRGLAVSYRKPV